MTTQIKPARHWLEALCLPDYARDIVQHPHLLRWRNDDWTAATDGRILVVVRGQPCQAQTCEEASKKLQPMLDAVATDPLDWVTFKAWLGVVPQRHECPVCGAVLRVEGERLVEDEAAPVLFRGRALDRNRLARVACYLDGQQALTSWCHNPNDADKVPMLVVDGPDWRIALMPLELTNVALDTLPAFQEATL